MCEEKKTAKGDSSENVGEVRLKKNKLSIPFINAVRATALKRYIGEKRKKLLPDQPVDREFEIYILSLCCNLLKEYYISRFKTSVKDDRKLMEQKDLKGHYRFAVMYRLQAKDIVISNMRSIEILMQILNKVVSGEDLKKAYTENYSSLESDTEFLSNRRIIRKYLRSYYYSSKK